MSWPTMWQCVYKELPREKKYVSRWMTKKRKETFIWRILTPVWPATQTIGLMRVVCQIYKQDQKWNMSHIFLIFFISFFLDMDTSGDQNTRYVYKVAYWIQKSCRSFVLIHPDITILSIPFENWRTGILWNHRRSQETMYHMSLRFYCFTHLFVDFFMSACSSCSLLCCYSYRTVT